MTTPDQTLEATLEAAYTHYMQAVYGIAKQYRQSHLIPFCRKNHLTFIAGNGTWYLGDDDGEQLNSDTDRPDDEGWQELLHILDAPIDGITWGNLGDLMNDVKADHYE